MAGALEWSEWRTCGAMFLFFTHGPLCDLKLGSLRRNTKVSYRSMRPHVKHAYNDKQPGALWSQDDLGENVYFPKFAKFRVVWFKRPPCLAKK